MLDFGYYNMDCMIGMKDFPDKYFDLAVVDPPYGIGESGAKNKTRSGGKNSTAKATAKDYKPFSGDDIKPASVEYFAELKRISKKQVIFGANHFIDNLPEPRNSSSWLVWDKENDANDFADCELAWSNVGGRSEYSDSNGMECFRAI